MSTPNFVKATCTVVLAFGLMTSGIVAEALISSADAQDLAATVLKRQDAMKGLGGRMKVIGEFLQEGKGSAENAAARASEISEIAKAIPSLFPAGTSVNDAVPKNRAKTRYLAGLGKV